MNFLSAALEYHRAGLKIIPFWTNSEGDKVFPSGYAAYRTRQTEADVRRLFGRQSEGVCLLCTDGIEAVDIDAKHDPKGTIVADLIESLDDFGFEMPGVVQITKSKGRHLIYRCPNPEGNAKLANRRGQKESMIETRGAGGLLFVAPTPGYQIADGDLLNIPAVTQEQRDELIRICRHFDEAQEVVFEKKVPEQMAMPTGKKSWEAYDEATDILGLMEGYGWREVGKQGDYIRLNRPGAKHSRGVDGSVIVSHNCFYPFTSSEQFEPNKGYSPSAVYAVMEHGGDFSRAAKELYRLGFGDRMEPSAEVKRKVPELVERVEKTRYCAGKIIKEPKALLKYEAERIYPVAGRGMIGMFTGQEKSGKSFVLSCVAASGLKRGGEVLNFSLDLDGGRLLWFDTEQSGYFYQKTQARVHRLAGIEQTPDCYAAYHLRQLNPAERVEVIEHYIYNTPDLSVVVIDGFVDLLADYNDLKATQEYVGRLMRWSDERQILILGVLHLNKGDGKVRGHLGSELKNKCDIIVNTTKQSKNAYSFSNPTSRYGDFPDQDFTRDDEGLPQYRSFAEHRGIPAASYGRTAPKSIDYTIPQSAMDAGRANEDDIPF